jgi:hypothetical protein
VNPKFCLEMGLIYERFILNFSIFGLIFHNLSKKCLNRFTDVVRAEAEGSVGNVVCADGAP